MRTLLLMVSLILVGTLRTQNLSDEALRPYVILWQNEQIDSLRSILVSVVKKFPGKPETLFFSAVYETNGEKAAQDLLTMVTKFPDSYFADEALFRLIQYDYALGQYNSAHRRAEELLRRFPKSPFVAKVSASGMKNIGEKPGGRSDTGQVETTRRYTLQLGAFSMVQNAEDLQKTLASAGFSGAVMGEKTVNGKRYFTVTWGAFSDKAQAQQEGEAIKAKMKLAYSVVEK